jgi:uncharacterized protein (DUF1015 family)
VTPPPAKAAAVSAPPYDVVSRQEAVALVRKNPLSFMRVTRADALLPETVDPYSDDVYARARENYRRLGQEAPLSRDATPSFYVYSLEMAGHRQTGIALAASVDDYELAIIRQHERTRPATEADRTRHILAVRAHTGPVFLAYRGLPAITEITARTTTSEPLFRFRSEDGVLHVLWRVAGPLTEELTASFASVPSLYIADGHHRAASASRAREACRQQNPDHTGTEGYNRFLAVAFPATELRILPYNRVVSTLNGRTPEALLAELGRSLDVAPADAPEPTAPGTFHMYLGAKWWRLRYPGRVPRLPTAEFLDVSLLQNLVLAPLFGISDPRADERIDFVGGVRGTEELQRRVDSGQAKVAFAMYPTTIDQLMAISDSGQIMPPKSTWFEPKLRDGIIVHEF